MAFIDVISYTSKDTEFAWKFPSDDLRIGTQLVVNTAQTAFFVKGGAIYDQFVPGTYTISTYNIPLLNRVINLPFGGASPFKAEIWYVNLINKLDCRWGTFTPVQLEDPKYGIIVPIRAYGQYGIRICDPRSFLETLVGNMTSYSVYTIVDYFKGKILALLTSLISQKMALENISILEINAHLEILSAYCQEKFEFRRYGVDIVDFSFMSINFPAEDESIRRLKEAKDLAAKIKITGRDVYQMDKSFEVLGKAAQNEGLSGSLMGAGVGLGVGVGMGNQFGNMMGGTVNTNPLMPPPPPPGGMSFFVYTAGQQSGPFDLNDLRRMATEGKINRSTKFWKHGMANWEAIDNIPELQPIISLVPPPQP